MSSQCAPIQEHDAVHNYQQRLVLVPVKFKPRIFPKGSNFQSRRAENAQNTAGGNSTGPAGGLSAQTSARPLSASIRQCRDALRRKIEQRPPVQNLVKQHILLSASRADPLIQQRVASLRKCGIVSNLNRKLRHRPGPLELITKRILRADAELEQAIAEGRLLFEPTSANTCISYTEPQTPFCPINPDMEVVSYPDEERFSPKTSVLKPKKKATPYRSPSDSSARVKNRPANVKEHESTPSGMDDNSSYQLLLKQQQIYLDWNGQETTEKPDGVGFILGPADCDSVSEKSNDEVQALSEAEAYLCSKMTTDLTAQASAPTPPMFHAVASPAVFSSIPKTLNDLRVQELKNECKKRGLPVSGAKPQLIERLKPYEHSIITESNQGGPSTPPFSPADPSDRQTPQPVVREQTRETIHDFLQQNAAKIRIANQNEAAKLAARTSRMHSSGSSSSLASACSSNSSSNSGRLVKLVDHNGVVIGTATVMDSSHSQRAVSSEPDLSHMQEPPLYNSVPTTSAPLPSLDQPNFRFAQMGSGGQFTLMHTPETVSNAVSELQAITPVSSIASVTPLPPLIPQNILPQMIPNQPQVIPTDQFATPSNVMINPNGVPVQIVQISQSAESVQYIDGQMLRPGFGTPRPAGPMVQVGFVDNDGVVRRFCQTASPVLADAAANSPNMPPGAVQQHDSPAALPAAAAAAVAIDMNDASSLTNTLHMHEEMLKLQQRKIAEMRSELVRSQQQLRTQQQLIMAAKKRQFGEGGRSAMCEHYIAQLRSVHLQRISSYKEHEAQVKEHVLEQNALVSAETKLQEELHVEQAINDIVRLIRQDARTALLIVQLLRKYQLEREALFKKPEQKSEESAPKKHKPKAKLTQTTNQMRAHSESPSQANLQVPVGQQTQRRGSNPETKRKAESDMPASAADEVKTHHTKTKSKSKKSAMPRTEPKPEHMDIVFKNVIGGVSDVILEDCNEATTSHSPAENVAVDVACNLAMPRMDVETVVDDHSSNLMMSQRDVPMDFVQPSASDHPAMVLDVDANAQTPPCYAPNNDFDDLMDVLRDDQGSELQNEEYFVDPTNTRAANDFPGFPYGQEELAKLIGDDWIDSAHRTIQQEGLSGSEQFQSEMDDSNMDWLDAMLQNTQPEESFDMRPSYFSRNEMDATC